jgi:hypothetical protein
MPQGPRGRGPEPPQPSQQQKEPALQSKMDPRPDYGVDSYKGSGKLKGSRAFRSTRRRVPQSFKSKNSVQNPLERVPSGGVSTHRHHLFSSNSCFKVVYLPSRYTCLEAGKS